MKKNRNMIFCVAGAVLLALSLLAGWIVSQRGALPDVRVQQVWAAATVLICGGLILFGATRRTIQGKRGNSKQSVYILKLTVCVFGWFLLINLVLRALI